MNRYRMMKAGININEGIHRFCGNVEIYESFLKKFLKDPNYDQMLSAINAGDVEASFNAAHALKGVAGNLSLDRLFHDLQPLVEELRAQRMEALEGMLEAIKADYEEIVAVLSNE